MRVTAAWFMSMLALSACSSDAENPVFGPGSGGSPGAAGAAQAGAPSAPSAGAPSSLPTDPPIPAATAGAGGGTSAPVAGTSSSSGSSNAGAPGASGGASGGSAGGDTPTPGSAGNPSTPPPPSAGSAACGTAPAGTQVGSPVENFTLTDQAGNSVSLSSYCDKVVYIAAGAMWCPGCRSDAEELEEIYQTYKDRGLVTLSMMAENARGRPPTNADLTAWAMTYGLTTPVLADPNWQVWNRYWVEGETPKEMLIGRGGILLDLSWPGTRDIERALQ